AEDVCVEREDFRSAREEERAGRRLRADAAETCEVFDGLCGWPPAQERKVERAMSLSDFTQQPADDRGLLVSEPAETYRLDERLHTRTQHSVPGPEALLAR